MTLLTETAKKRKNRSTESIVIMYYRIRRTLIVHQRRPQGFSRPILPILSSAVKSPGNEVGLGFGINDTNTRNS